MTLREHVILGGGAATVLSPVLGAQGSLVFWASSVLIDADHYWDYLCRNGFRSWSPSKTFAFHRVLIRRIHRPEFLGLNLFHTVEWFLLVYVGGVWLGSSIIFAAFWGMLFHLGLDVAGLAGRRATFKRALSLMEYWIRRRRLVRRGLDPDEVYHEALVEIGVVHAPSPVPVRAGFSPQPSAQE